MGIKKLGNRGQCFDCGIQLLVPSWKWCELHDPRRRKTKMRWGINKKKNKKLFVHIVSNRNLTNYYKVAPSLKGMDFSNKEYLVYDENNIIIGYR